MIFDIYYDVQFTIFLNDDIQYLLKIFVRIEKKKIN